MLNEIKDFIDKISIFIKKMEFGSDLITGQGEHGKKVRALVKNWIFLRRSGSNWAKGMEIQQKTRPKQTRSNSGASKGARTLDLILGKDAL